MPDHLPRQLNDTASVPLGLDDDSAETMMDDFLDSSESLYHRKITQMQLRLREQFERWHTKAMRWAREQDENGLSRRNIRELYGLRRAEVLASLRQKRDDFVMMMEQERANRDLAIILHFRPDERGEA